MTAKQRDTILKDAELSKSILTDKEAAELLGIGVRTLQVYVSKGKYTGLFSLSPVNNKRFWYKTKLMGL
ncbi:MAG: helix-turn-helix domain-containing protein [Agriterribacter sp.]